MTRAAIGRRLPMAGALIALLLAAGGRGVSAQTVTFGNVAPILHQHCATCHHPGGDGPFSLLTYGEVKRHSTAIAAAVKSGYMPPWKPSRDSGPFLGERRLTAAEIDTVQRWVAEGAPEGTSTPPAPRFASGWRLGEPDLVLPLPAYTLAAEGPDTFRNFVVAVPGNASRYVRGYQFRPGSAAVHHANLRIDRTAASRQLDDADPNAGYEGLILNSAEYPDGHFLGWTPGQAAALGSNDLAWRLEGGSDLVIQLHMQPTGRPELVQPSIGFYFSDKPPTSTPVILRLGRQNLVIAPGDAAYRTTDRFVLPVEVNILAVQPHSHMRAREVSAIALLPDGSRRTLIHIADWDFRWQDQYRLAQPLWLPAGSTLEMEYIFDNSSANVRNPDRPPQRVEWGWRTSDEMGDVWIQMQTRTTEDRERLALPVRRKMVAEQAIGSEVLATRNPDHVSVRNDAAVTYLELGRTEDALRHFAAVTRLAPASAVAWYNEGVALEALGRRAEAAARYRQAILLDPSYSQAHNNLGNMLAQENQLAEAMASYRRAIQYAPANAEAHCSLAQALMVTGRPQDAKTEFTRALELRQDWPVCATSLVWLLSAHNDAAVREPARAVMLGEQIVRTTRSQDYAALDALAAAYASASRFGDAVRTGEMALRLVENSPLMATAASIRERLALYRRRQPFIVPE